MSDISTWTPNADGMLTVPPPDGFPEGQAPSTVNDSSREVQAAVRRQHERAEWIDYGHAVTRITGTQFQVLNGDFRDIYTAVKGGRRLRLEDSATLYGTITDVNYAAPNTVVDVALDSGALTSSLSAVSVGVNSPKDSSLGDCAFTNAGTGIDNQQNQLNLDISKLTNVANPDTQNGTFAMRRSTFHEEVDLSSIAGGIAGTGENIEIDCGVSGADRIATVTADLVILRSTNGAMYPVRNINAAADVTDSGIGGLDTGVPEPNQWYYIYVLTDRSSVGVMFSKNRSYNITRPAGWSYMGLVGAAYYIDDTTRFRTFLQHGKVVAYAERYLRRDGSVATNTWDQIDMSDAVPRTASKISLTLSLNNGAVLGVSPYSNGVGGVYFTNGAQTASNFGNALEVARDKNVSATVPIFAGRDLWTFSDASPLAVHVTGFELA